MEWRNEKMLMISQYHLLDRKDAAIRDKRTTNN